MLIRLTRAARFRVASALAFLYLLCVLAPAAAFAFGDGSRAAHCLTDDNHGLRPVHAHEHNAHEHNAHEHNAHEHNGHKHDGNKHDGGGLHVHEDGTNHEHSKAPGGKSTDGQCCGLACLSALPAAISEVEAPALPALVAVSADQESIAGNPPDRLYRPPISPPSH